MGSVPKKAVSKPPADRQPMCDNDILRLLADQTGRSIAGMATHFWVTATAIRDRLVRLTTLQMVTRRHDGEQQRGRPRYLYYITGRGAAELAPPDDEGMD